MMAFPGTYQQRRNTIDTKTNEGRFMRYTAIFLILVLSLTSVCFATGPVKPSARDKCPVCGMFVAKSPDFLAEIVFKDGSCAIFDGPKDMFKYYLNLPSTMPPKNKRMLKLFM